MRRFNRFKHGWGDRSPQLPQAPIYSLPTDRKVPIPGWLWVSRSPGQRDILTHQVISHPGSAQTIVRPQVTVTLRFVVCRFTTGGGRRGLVGAAGRCGRLVRSPKGVRWSEFGWHRAVADVIQPKNCFLRWKPPVDPSGLTASRDMGAPIGSSATVSWVPPHGGTVGQFDISGEVREARAGATLSLGTLTNGHGPCPHRTPTRDAIRRHRRENYACRGRQ
jgi:hypothetical protein